MDVNDKDVATIGTIASLLGAGAGGLMAWAATAVAAGKRYQEMKNSISQNRKDIEKLNRMIDKLHSCFVTSEGEPRLVSFAAHDIIQKNCQTRMDERHDRLSDRLQAHDAKLDRILEDLAMLRGSAVAFQPPDNVRN